MSDVFNNFGGAFFDDDLGYHEQPFLIQSSDQHDFGCQTNYLPIDLCQQCGPYSPRYNAQSSLNIPVFQSNGRRHDEPRCTGMTYAQAVATRQPVRTPSFSTPTYIQPQTAFPPLRAESPTLPANVTIGHNAQGSTYAQVAQRANRSPTQQQERSTTNLCSPHTQAPFHAGQYIAPDQIRADHGTAGQLLPHSVYAGAPQRHARPQRRPSRSYHTAQNNDPIQDFAQYLEDAIPSAVQPEINRDPRSVSTFIQRTQRGAHRRSISSSAGPSIPSTPAVPATLSTSSITSRRKGEAMRDPTLPFACPVCGKTYHTHEDRKRHIARTHSSVESRPHRCGQLGCGKAFIHPKDLRRHAATHLPPVHIDCPHPDCEKDFTRQDNLDRHLRDFHLVDSGFAGSTSTSRRGSFMAPRLDHNF